MRGIRKLLVITWVAIRELLYERVFYVLLTFALGAISLSLVLGQMTYNDQQKLSLDFMLAGIHLSMVLFSIFIGISLFKKELLLGSVAMVLSKPVSRVTFLLGKFLGQSIVQFMVTMAMVAVSLLLCRRLSHFSALAIWQSGWLIYLEISIITAITYLFAVNSGSVTTAIAAMVMFCLGHLREAITLNIATNQSATQVWKVVKTLIPDFELFNMKSLAAYGIALNAPEVFWASVYAAICLFFFLFLAGATFQRKDILT